MKVKTFEEFDEVVEDVFEALETSSLSTKLDRRRRIEELEDEKRLRAELCEFA